MKPTLIHKTLAVSLVFHAIVLTLFALFLPSKVTSFVRLPIELAPLPDPPEVLGRDEAEPVSIREEEPSPRKVRIYLPEVERDPLSEIVSMQPGATPLTPREDLLPGRTGFIPSGGLALPGPGRVPGGRPVSGDPGYQLSGPAGERRVIHAPLPDYPVWAQEQGLEAYLELKIWIDAAGSVTEVIVQRSSGYPELDRLCLGAVGQWRFEAGGPESSWALLPLRFHLQ